MAPRGYRALLKKLLTGFLLEEDPLESMLEWLEEELMRVEAEVKVGAPKHKPSQKKKTYFSGYRVRKLNLRSDDLSNCPEGDGGWLKHT